MSDQNYVDKINLKTKKMAPQVWPDQIAGTVFVKAILQNTFFKVALIKTKNKFEFHLTSFFTKLAQDGCEITSTFRKYNSEIV